MNKPGSSNYERGDTGGAHGDYEHGVSKEWINKRVGSANASHERMGKFFDKQGKAKTGKRLTAKAAAAKRLYPEINKPTRSWGDSRAPVTGSLRGDKKAAEASVGRRPTAKKSTSAGGKSNWDAWNAKKGKK